MTAFFSKSIQQSIGLNMKSNEFSDFMEKWREAIIYGDEASKFMRGYFSPFTEEFVFSEAQLMEIAATISGNQLPDVELHLGNTKLEPATFIPLYLALRYIKGIQVAYELKASDLKYVHSVCPKVNLTSVLSTDKNIKVEVDARNVVINSSTILRSGATRKEEPAYEPVKVLDALKNAHEVLVNLSAKNQQMKESINVALSGNSKNLSKFTMKMCKELSGMALSELTNSTNHNSIEILFILRSFETGLQQDYEKYQGWAKVFRVISNLVEMQYQLNKAATYKHHVDKVVLLFADFIAINQNGTWERFKGNQESLNTQELRQLREVLDILLTDAISSDYDIASRIFNGTEINAFEPGQSQIACRAALHAPSMVLILDKLAEIILIEDENNLPFLEKALTACRQLAEWPLKKPSVLSTEALTSYKTLDKLYGKTYSNCLQIVSILDELGIKDCLLMQDTQQPVEKAHITNIERCISIFTESAKSESNNLQTGLNSTRVLFMECASALFELCLIQGDAHNVDQDIDEWIRRKYFPAISDFMAKNSEPGKTNSGSGTPRTSEISMFKQNNKSSQNVQSTEQAKVYRGGLNV